MFPVRLQHAVKRNGGVSRARESDRPLWVAGQRIKIFLALFPLWFILTRRQAPGFLFLDRRARKHFSRKFFILEGNHSLPGFTANLRQKFWQTFARILRNSAACLAPP
jgi:hypothetical protein